MRSHAAAARKIGTVEEIVGDSLDALLAAHAVAGKQDATADDVCLATQLLQSHVARLDNGLQIAGRLRRQTVRALRQHKRRLLEER